MKSADSLAAFAAMTAVSCAVLAQDDPVPIPDLGAGTYHGAAGGLYPDGENHPPPAHLLAALEMADLIVPRNAAGAFDPGGAIGMISVGMSNTNQEFGAFHHEEDGNTGRNARLVIVNAAQGGQDSTTIANPGASYWSNAMAKIEASGLTADQVQVAWLKEAKANPQGGFPEHALLLRDELEQIVQILHQRFPNLRLCYLATRIYGGYASGGLNPEPYAYETGFAVKWLIEDQIDGDLDLNYGQLPGPVRAPLLLWGPYMWADGATPSGQGLFWLPEDFEQGGTNPHPSPAGEQKVAFLLSSFFANHSTAQAWWPKQPGAALIALDPTDDTYVNPQTPNTSFGAEPLVRTRGGAEPLHTYLRFDASAVTGPIIDARLHLRIQDEVGGGEAVVMGVDNTDWSEDTLTFANAPSPLLPALASVPGAYSRGGSFGVPVTDHVAADADDVVSFTVRADPQQGGSDKAYHSKEEAEGRSPRLVIAVQEPFCPADVVSDAVVDVSDLVAVITGWGPCTGPCPADIDGDGTVGVADLVEVILTWGPCF